MSAITSRIVANKHVANRSPDSRKKKRSKTLSDEKDGKYSKIQESKDRLMFRVSVAISFVMVIGVILTHGWFEIGQAAGISHGELKRLRRNTGEVGVPVPAHHLSDVGDKQDSSNRNPKSLQQLEQKRLELDRQVREIKATGVIMETDEKSLRLTRALQGVTREVLREKYGHAPIRVKVDLEFQESVPDFEENGPRGTLVIEMAPVEYIPVSVYNWLEIARTWESGEFHRNADHVLQATTHAGAVTKPLAFQEYSEHYPHEKGTVGYCGRPSGPCWYVSIRNNTRNHGPGSQQKKNPHEADANFGKIVGGWDDVVPRIHSISQKGWLGSKSTVFIRTMTILVAGPGGEFVEWQS